MGRSNDHDPAMYEIRLAGHLDGRWATHFEGLAMSHEADGTTVLSGPMLDQAELHGLLQRVRDLGVPLVSVVRPDVDHSAGLETRSTDQRSSR